MMAEPEDVEQSAAGEGGGGEATTLGKKKLLAAIKAKREGTLSPDDFRMMNVQLAARARQPIILTDTDPTDPMLFFDADPTDRIVRFPP
jgi:hypothetical protein